MPKLNYVRRFGSHSIKSKVRSYTTYNMEDFPISPTSRSTRWISKKQTIHELILIIKVFVFAICKMNACKTKANEWQKETRNTKGKSFPVLYFLPQQPNFRTPCVLQDVRAKQNWNSHFSGANTSRWKQCVLFLSVTCTSLISQTKTFMQKWKSGLFF